MRCVRTKSHNLCLLPVRHHELHGAVALEFPDDLHVVIETGLDPVHDDLGLLNASNQDLRTGPVSHNVCGHATLNLANVQGSLTKDGVMSPLVGQKLMSAADQLVHRRGPTLLGGVASNTMRFQADLDDSLVPAHEAVPRGLTDQDVVRSPGFSQELIGQACTSAVCLLAGREQEAYIRHAPGQQLPPRLHHCCGLPLGVAGAPSKDEVPFNPRPEVRWNRIQVSAQDHSRPSGPSKEIEAARGQVLVLAVEAQGLQPASQGIAIVPFVTGDGRDLDPVHEVINESFHPRSLRSSPPATTLRLGIGPVGRLPPLAQSSPQRPRAMFLTSLLLTLTPASTPAVSIQDSRREKVTAQYEALCEARDEAALGKLWNENVGLVLQIIDADLEGSLALWEKSKSDPPQDDIARLQARALYGARIASSALSQPIFIDYASSFVGWNDDQKAAFRSGQAVYGRAMQELKGGNHEVAFEAGKETVERASALGDWWGMAMGYGAEAEAARQLGWFEDSLRAFALARQINHDLGLQHSEYKNLQGMLAVARADERFLRAYMTTEPIIEYAKAFKDSDTLSSTLKAKLELEKTLDLQDAAAETKRQLDALN